MKVCLTLFIFVSLIGAGCAVPASLLTRADRPTVGWLRFSKRMETTSKSQQNSDSNETSARQIKNDGSYGGETFHATDKVDAEQELSFTVEPTIADDGPIRQVRATEQDVPPRPTQNDEVRSYRNNESSFLVGRETLPIDFVTVLRLVNENSPAISFSRARVAEAQARAQAAKLQWLPNLTAGAAYNRFDGQTQNQRGEIFEKSRSNLFPNGGAALTLDFAEAIYRPLIERRMAAAEQQRANATSLSAELDAILAYLDLIQSHGLLEINAQTLEKGEAMLVAARNAQKANLDRSPGDVNRVRTDILLRRQERLDLQGRSNVASTRLGKLLLLRASVRLVPQNGEIVPITLVTADLSALDDLVATAVQNRPDLAANRELLVAAWERVRKAQRGPLLPKLQAIDQGGSFGGGLNADMGDFKGRNVLTGMLYWELKNLGFGNHIEVQERQAGVGQAHSQLLETQARLAAEVVEATQIADAKYQSLGLAEEAVQEATELYRISQEGTFNVVDAKNLFDALRPLQALQVLQQTRQNYLAAIVDYNRAQYRLYTAIGCPHGNSIP